MAGSYSDYVEKKILDHVWGGPDYVRPAVIYVGLSSTAVNEDGTNNTEPSAGSYARIAITNNATNFPPAAGNPTQKACQIELDFPKATAPWAGAGVKQIEATFWDAASGGNFLGSSTLPDGGREVLLNDQLYFPAGTFVVGQG